MIRDDITKRINDLSRLIELLEDKIKNMPAGSIRIKNQDGFVYYYHVLNNENLNGIYIPRTESSLIIGLVQKEYHQKVIRSARQELKALSSTLYHFPKTLAEEIYLTLPDVRKHMVVPIKRPDDEYVRAWQAEEYVHKGFKEGDPYYETMNKERVRSKSEMLIADHLKMAGIPYKYEYPVRINNVLYHPDFKILRVSDRKELYLEHCGMLDDKKYCNDLVTKLNDYAMNGIYIGNNLYLLFETDKYPLDMRVLDIMIDKCFR